MACEFFLMIDEDGDFVIAKDKDGLGEVYENEVTADNGLARRIVKLSLNVAPPKPLTVTGDVPENASGKVALTIG